MWNGSTLRAVMYPAPAGAKGWLLSAVSCASASRCVAVGYYAEGPHGVVLRALAETWNGSTWRFLKVHGPRPTTAGLNQRVMPGHR